MTGKRSSSHGLQTIWSLFILAFAYGHRNRWRGMQPKRYFGPRATVWEPNPETGRKVIAGHVRR